MKQAKTVLELAYTESMSVANSAAGDSRAAMSTGTFESYGEGDDHQQYGRAVERERVSERVCEKE